MKHSQIFIRYPEGRFKALTFSFDDGSFQDEWLCDLMKSLGLKATFNVNMGLLPDSENFNFDLLDETVFPGKKYQKRLTADGLRRVFADSGMELACHGFLHAELPRLDDGSALYELIRDREALENLTGDIVRGYAYPQGNYDKRSGELCRKAGFAYARTVAFTGNFGLPLDFMMWAPTCQYAEDRAMTLADELIAAKPGRCKYYPDTEAKLFYIFAHSYEFDVTNSYDKMENLARKLAGHEDEIWYCTNIEYCRYTMAFRSLEYNLDRTKVYNPSAIPVWIFANDETVKVLPGETVDI